MSSSTKGKHLLTVEDKETTYIRKNIQKKREKLMRRNQTQSAITLKEKQVNALKRLVKYRHTYENIKIRGFLII